MDYTGTCGRIFLFSSRGSVLREFVGHDARLKDAFGRVVERGLDRAHNQGLGVLDLARLRGLARRDVEERASSDAEDLQRIRHGTFYRLDDLLLGLLDAALLSGLVRVEAEGPAA